MRTKALILLFPFAVFLIETASFVPALVENCTIVASRQSSCCMKEKKQEQCQSRKEESSCTKKTKQDECRDKKADNKNSSENKCADNPDCTTCPVCYTFIFQPQYEWPAKQFLLKKNYSLLTTGYISSYTNDVWKPPNGFLYSS